MEFQAVAAFVLAYLIGSIDFGVLLPRLVGIDIYSVGSGNPGTSNVVRTMGKRWGAVVLVGDLGKGLIAVLIADLWAGDVAAYAAMFAVVAGHCFPFWHRFQGGKGVASTLGALLWLAPVLGIVCVTVWALIVGFFRVASIASLVTMATIVVVLPFLDVAGWSLFWAYATVGLVVVRHRGNMERMLRGGDRTVEAA